MRYYVTLPGTHERAVDVVRTAAGSLDVRVDGATVSSDCIDASPACNALIGTRVFDLWLDSAAGERHPLFACGLRVLATVETERSRIGARASRPSAGGGGGSIAAPMPGRVIKVLVSVGDQVEAGAPLVVVEAMKMENELCAAGAGVVAAIHASAGQTVEGGAILCELGPLPHSC